MKKDLRKLVAPIIAVVALGVGTYFGLSDEDVTTLESALTIICTSVLTISGLIGVYRNNDK